MNLKVGVALINALITGAALTAGGCTVGPDYHPPGIELRPFHSAIADATPKAVAVAESPDGWWTGFHDPMLALVVERGAATEPGAGRGIGTGSGGAGGR